MKPIETTYNGRRYRSRLEARWAVFFDGMGIRYEYEAEGYWLSTGPYLPDFWLPTFGGGMHVEVKPSGGDFSKAYTFAAEGRRAVWLAEGEPAYRAYRVLWDGEDWYWAIPLAGSATGQDRMYSDPDDVGTNGELGPTWFHSDGTPSEAELALAVESALSARFEFGERGRHGFALAGDVLEELKRGPRIGRAIHEAELRQRAVPRPEGDLPA